MVINFRQVQNKNQKAQNSLKVAYDYIILNIYIIHLNKFMTKYWCYVCDQQFELNRLATKCPTCQQQAFEEMTAQSHPQQFQVYQPTAQLQNTLGALSTVASSIGPTMQQFSQPMQGLINILQNTANQLSNTYNQNPQAFGTNPAAIVQNSINFSVAQLLGNLPQIMNLTGQMTVLMQNLINSGQSYRPATQQQINALVKIGKPKQCTICQAQAQQEGVRLNCGHQFHSECLSPWLQRANTCPTCRKPL